MEGRHEEYKDIGEDLMRNIKTESIECAFEKPACWSPGINWSSS